MCCVVNPCLVFFSSFVLLFFCSSVVFCVSTIPPCLCVAVCCRGVEFTTPMCCVCTLKGLNCVLILSILSSLCGLCGLSRVCRLCQLFVAVCVCLCVCVAGGVCVQPLWGVLVRCVLPGDVRCWSWSHVVQGVSCGHFRSLVRLCGVHRLCFGAVPGCVWAEQLHAVPGLFSHCLWASWLGY